MEIKNNLMKVARNVHATFACTFASCVSTMMALAGDSLDYDPSVLGDNVFAGMGSTLLALINSAASMLRSFVIPLAVVAALSAIIMMYLPGMSSKVTDRCKTVIWSCIATIAIAAALSGIFRLAANVGGDIAGKVN